MALCPYCGAEIRDGVKFCTECGGKLTQSTPRPQQAALVGNTGVLLGRAARQARLEAVYAEDEIISDFAYNAVLLGVVIWGLLVNFLMCRFLGSEITWWLYWHNINPILPVVVYFVCAIAGILISAKSHKPLISFLGYNLVVIPFGVMLAIVVEGYGGIDARVVTDAFLYTLFITVGMTGAALAFPKLFSKLGGALLGTLGGLVICEILLLIFRVDQSVTDWIAAGLFSLYIGYDVYRSQQFARTVDNAVDCALDIYLDIANLFLRLLSILGKKDD
ncbi:MAG: Bax inhibitor-1 family protein [Oscillospiraceae bacterium]|nr:Bax inhibitor-1 family protein [Oscillospiraceae bacterium]